MAARSSFRRSIGVDDAHTTERSRLGRALTLVARLSPVSRFTVADESMRPAYAPGERIVVSRIAYLLRTPRAGDVVVLRDPESPGRWLLKRIAATPADGRLDVRGDNARVSRDSRAFGTIPRDAIVGKVWFKY